MRRLKRCVLCIEQKFLDAKKGRRGVTLPRWPQPYQPIQAHALQFSLKGNTSRYFRAHPDSGWSVSNSPSFQWIFLIVSPPPCQPLPGTSCPPTFSLSVFYESLLQALPPHPTHLRSAASSLAAEAASARSMSRSLLSMALYSSLSRAWGHRGEGGRCGTGEGGCGPQGGGGSGAQGEAMVIVRQSHGSYPPLHLGA